MFQEPKKHYEWTDTPYRRPSYHRVLWFQLTGQTPVEPTCTDFAIGPPSHLRTPTVVEYRSPFVKPYWYEVDPLQMCNGQLIHVTVPFSFLHLSVWITSSVSVDSTD